MKRTDASAIRRVSFRGAAALAAVNLFFCAARLGAADVPLPEFSVLRGASWEAGLDAPPTHGGNLPRHSAESHFGDIMMSPTHADAATAGATSLPDSHWGFQPDGTGQATTEEGWLRPLRRGHPDDVGRHVGRGLPLVGTSWLNRPYHGGWLVGTLFGDALLDGRVDQGDGLFGGYRLGWDFDHYWGVEGRIAFAHLELTDLVGGIGERTGRNYYLDGHVLYYPWGDARLRPYFSVGLGSADFEFRDNEGTTVDETSVHLPLSLGCKFLWKNWLALRVALEDNFALGSGAVDSMHNWSLNGGAEVRFGRRPRRYFAYD